MMDPKTRTNLDNLKAAINNKYLEAEQLMLKTENTDQLKSVNQEISEIFNELIAKLELIPEYLRLAIEDYPSITDWTLKKTEFDNRLSKFLEKSSSSSEPSDDAIGRQASYSGNSLEQEPISPSVDEEWANNLTKSDQAAWAGFSADISMNEFDDHIDRQASFSGNCLEQEPSSSSADEKWENTSTKSDQAAWAVFNADMSMNKFDDHIDRQVPLTDSNEQRFDSHYQQDFEPIRCLGKGAFGVVFESRNKVDQRNYAIKRIRLSNKPGARKKAEREVRALERLKNRGIVGYVTTWTETPPQGWQEKTDEELRLDLSSFQSSGSSSTSSSTDTEKIKNQSGRNEASDSSGLTDLCTPQEWQEKTDEELMLDRSSFQSSGSSSTASFTDVQKIKKQSGRDDAFDFSGLTNLCANTWTETPPQGRQEKTDEELMLDICSFQSGGSNSTSSSTDIEKIKNQSGRNKVSDSCVFFENTNEKSRNTNEKPRKKKENIEHTFLYIQMELCQKESLKTWLENNHSRDKENCLEIFHQVLGAVEYIHDNNFMHRDLKPSNIFFSLHGVIKVGDFGLVTETDDERIDDISKNSEINEGTHTKGVGTRLYMAPEQMSENYGKKVDVFALGLILFELFSPFSTQMERICEMEKARDSKFDERFQNRNEVRLVELVKRMLSSQPSLRPTAQGGMLTYFWIKTLFEMHEDVKKCWKECEGALEKCEVDLKECGGISIKRGPGDFGKAEKDFEKARRDFENAQSDCDKAQRDFEKAQKDVITAQRDFEKRAQKDILSALREFESKRRDFEIAQRDFEIAQRDYESALRDYKSALRDLDSAQRDFLSTGRDFLSASRDLESARRDLENARRNLKSERKDLESAHRDFKRARRNFENAQRNFESARKNFERARRDF